MTGSLSSMSSDQSVGVTSSVSSLLPVDACPNIHGFEVRIDSTHNYEEFTLYEIKVRYRYASWKVRRRYREFAELHSELSRVYPSNQMCIHGFPGKRMLGNFSKKFVERRRKKLEEYLRNAFQALKAIPKPLAYFLDMQKYELNWIVHTLSESIYNRTQYNESLQLHIQRSRNFQLDTLQLHAIHQRMSLQLLPDAYEMTEAAVNLAHLMDFAFNLRVLKVEGRRHRAGTSDWQLNQVPFSLAYFKSLKHLQFECVNLEMIEVSSFEMLTQYLVNLHCHKSISTCSAVLNPTSLPNPPQWNSLVRLNLSKNNLTSIDESICLAPKLQFLDLSYNHLNCIQNLSNLCSLRDLNLSHNNFSYLEDLNTKLGNIKKLFLDHNKLFSLDGLGKLYSIEKLSCNANRLCELHDINAISRMPCLESVSLKENPLCSILDYRTKVLEIFQDRAPEVILDGLMTTARELDTVRVLVALSKARKRSRGLARAHTFSGVPTTDSDHETPHGAVCSLRSSESRTFSRMEVREIMEKEKQDVTEQGLESEKLHQEANFVPCHSVKHVKSGLVLGLTGEVSMIDWNTIIENLTDDSNSNSAPLLLHSCNSNNDIAGTNPDDVTGRITLSERDALRNLATFLSSNVSSRTECTRLFSFIIRQEENKDESLTQTQSFLQLIKQFVLSPAADLTRSSWHDPFALSASGTTQTNSAVAAAAALAEEEESYPSYVLWEQVTRSNKSAITTLPLSNGFRALASCDCRKFVNIFHDQLICVPHERERLRFSMWCYLQLKKSMSFPKQAIVFVTNQKVYVYFDSSGGCILNTLEDNTNDKMARVANKNRRRVVQLSSKRRSLLNGHGLVVPPIEELANNLYLVLDVPINQFTNVQLSTTGQCANFMFNGKNHMNMLVGTMDSVDLEAFCEQIKNAAISCPLNLFELRDLIFTTQSNETSNVANTAITDFQDQAHSFLVESQSSTKSSHKLPGRIFFASNLMRLKVNDEIQSTFPILVLSESFLCFCKDPLVMTEIADDIDSSQERDTKQEATTPLVNNSGVTSEVDIFGKTSGDATAPVSHNSIERKKLEPECSSSKDFSSVSEKPVAASENDNILAMHKISNILILKLAESSNNICLSVRTLVHSIDELSDSLELNLQEDYYDDTDESKQNGNLPICYIDFSFRLTKDKERFVFLLQKRFEDVAKKRIAIINS